MTALHPRPAAQRTALFFLWGLLLCVLFCTLPAPVQAENAEINRKATSEKKDPSCKKPHRIFLTSTTLCSTAPETSLRASTKYAALPWDFFSKYKRP